MRQTVGGFDDTEGDIAGAARNVQNLVGRVLARRKRRDHRVLPQPVQASRHYVIHDVVALGHLMEDLVDQPLLFAFVHLVEAIGRFHAALGSGTGVGHRLSPYLLRGGP
ncbi:hypothetical protein D3C78_958210 [compost metagenome]